MSPEQEKWILKYLLARLTQMWGWWPERRAVLNAAENDDGTWTCAECGVRCARSEREVDHADAVGVRPKSLAEFIPYLKRKLCSRTNLRVLCKERCHRKKTALDARKRADGVKRRKAAKRKNA